VAPKKMLRAVTGLAPKISLRAPFFSLRVPFPLAFRNTP